MSSISFASRKGIISRSAKMRSNSTAMSSREVLPATPVSNDDALLPSWFSGVSRRIDELSRLPKGWDSYGASALNEDAADALSETLRQRRYAIQSQPSISLNDEGGLVAEWENPEYSLELLVNPGVEIYVYHHDIATNREWEMPISHCDMLDKWLWRASSQV